MARSREEIEREAESLAFLSTLSHEERILRAFGGRGSPLTEGEVRERHALIRAMADCGELRGGFAVVRSGDGCRIVETFGTTGRGRYRPLRCETGEPP